MPSKKGREVSFEMWRNDPDAGGSSRRGIRRISRSIAGAKMKIFHHEPT